MNENFSKDEIRRQCHDKALHSLGTYYIFQCKAQFYEKLIKVNSLLGILVPLVFGAIALTYGLDSVFTKSSIKIFYVLVLVQAIYSGLSIVNKWDSKIAYCFDSMADNYYLSQEFSNLGRLPPGDLSELNCQFRVLAERNRSRETMDIKVNFSQKENRKGMRYALMIYGRECLGCKEVPISMRPTNCDVCGNF